MQEINKSFNRTSKNFPSGVYGLLSITFGAMGDLIAYIMYPGYDFRQRAVSSLCLGPGWLFFQSGTVISGIFALLFLLYLEKTFSDEENLKNIRKYAKLTGIISCTSFILLGIFCGSNLIIAYIHGINAIISWIFGMLYLSLFNTLMIKSFKYSKYVGYFGFITSIALSLMMFLFLLHLFPAFRFIMKILPELEWMNTVSLIIWYLVVSIYVIDKKF